MKIRKLILKAKLEQIEKNSQNIFLFHCSANASQWRFLKNFLHNQAKVKSSDGLSNQNSTHLVGADYLKGFTFFQSKHIRKNYPITSKKCGKPNLENSKTTNYEPKGSLIYFERCAPQNVIDSHENNIYCFKLVTSLESNNEQFFFLCGQVNSKSFNHCDLKHSLTLNSQSIYHEFLLSLQLINFQFQNCLHQNISDFLSSQERRHLN